MFPQVHCDVRPAGSDQRGFPGTMKKIIFLLAAVFLGFTACKKEVLEIHYHTSAEDVQPKAGEDYNVSDSFIRSNSFVILKAYNNQGNGKQAWKLKAVNAEKYVYIEGNLTYWFWRKGYQENDIIDGDFVLDFLPKRR